MVLKYLLYLLSIYLTMFGQILAQSDCIYKYIDGGVSKSDANFILKKHNDFRKLIANDKVSGQPRGINMKELKWDDELAKKAQSLANTCVYGHRSLNDTRWPVGQNLYRKRSNKFHQDVDWNRALQAWYEENEIYTYSNITVKSAKGTGHYTQIVWATTEYVGYGYSFFETKEKMKYQKIYICNYGPGGNVRGMLPYKTGDKGCENLC